jgi:hypothetical protein
MKVRTRPDIHQFIIDECDYRELRANTIYEVIGIDDDDYRIVGEEGMPYLYSKALFEIIDSSIPDSWIRHDYDDGGYYIDPPELSPANFSYEDFFDDKPEAIRTFQKFVESFFEE